MTELIECVTILRDDTYKLISSLKRNDNTVNSRGCEELFGCPMFTIRKKEFDKVIGRVCQKEYDNQTMPSIQAKLGLPKEWDKYNKLMTFKVKSDKLYRPFRLINGRTVAARRLYQEKLLSENLTPAKVSQLEQNKVLNIKNINQILDYPFLGTGETMVYNIKVNSINATRGFKEYVLPSRTPLKNVKLYDTYKKYCDDTFGENSQI